MSRGVMAIRIDDKTRARVARAARRQGTSPSEAIRTAIDSWLDEEEASHTTYDRVSDLVGCFEGPPDLSSHGGRRVAELLKKRAKALE